MSGRRRLSLVSPDQELEGKGPQLFEQLARAAEVGTPEHRGLVGIAVTLAQRSAGSCVPPSAKVELLGGLDTARLWLNGRASAGDVAGARARVFQAVSAIEQMTARAVEKARAQLAQGPATPLDAHADHVVERYARLAAHFATSGVCHALDAVATPTAALEVLQDVEGARAYQASGLGAARHAAFRAAAWDQASWENSRPGTESSEAARSAIAVQVFHEYLGGRWRVHADAERTANSEFIRWALSGRSAR